jgi:aspartyl-tRNA(Asn)/glutamyl-tRNA(Gln) amidotransferase subunit C
MITKKDVEHVARLARVALTEEEKEKFTVQLGNILGHIEKLKELDTSKVGPTAHPFFVHTVWREDRLEPFADREGILKNAPDREEIFFKVPKVIE